MEKSFLGPKTAIEETEKVLEEQFDSVNSFKQLQSRMLTSLSFIVSALGLLTGLQATSLIISPVVLTAIMLLFVCFLIIYSLLLMPTSLEMPFRIEFDVFKEMFFEKPEKEILENKLENYIAVVKNNRRKINRLLWFSRISAVIYLIILGLVMATLLNLL